MEKAIIHVEGMSCEHCVKAVKQAVSALSGVSHVDVELVNKKVAVAYDAAQVTLETIKAAIDDQGYEVVE